MKCNLPKGFKASVSNEARFDSPSQYVIKSMSQVDRTNMPMGYNESPKMAYGTGKTYNFTNNARSRKNVQAREHRDVMSESRKSEGSRFLQRVNATKSSSSDNSFEM